MTVACRPTGLLCATGAAGNNMKPTDCTVQASAESATTLPQFEDFRRIMSNGWVVRNRHYALHGWHNPDQNGLGIAYGLLVPKRLAPRAARRTLIKRQMRTTCVPVLTEWVYLSSLLEKQLLPSDCTIATTKDKNAALERTKYAKDHSESRRRAAKAHTQCANQFIIRFARSYPRNDYRSAQSTPLAQRIRRDLQHLLRNAQQKFTTQIHNTPLPQHKLLHPHPT